MFLSIQPGYPKEELEPIHLPNVQDNGFFIWPHLVPPIEVNLCFSSILSFALYFAHPKQHWQTITLEILKEKFVMNEIKGRLNQHRIIFLEGMLTFKYVARREFDPCYNGLRLCMSIHEVVVNLYEQATRLASEFRFRCENHKISLHMIIGDKGGHRTILGRPQVIETTQGAWGEGTRTYTWSSKVSPSSPVPPLGGTKTGLKERHNSFPGIPRRESLTSHLDDLRSIQDVKLLGPLVVFKDTPEGLGYIPDHDGYQNTNVVLPIMIGNMNVLILQLFNGKHDPATFMEHVLKTKYLLKELPQTKGKRLSGKLPLDCWFKYQEAISEFIDVTIVASVTSTGNVLIQEVNVSVRNYKVVLERWGKDGVLKTV